jgi:hypothetical protein
MIYTMDKKLAEANAAFLICEAIRRILLKELNDGEDPVEILNKLVGFYRVTSPRMADSIGEFALEHRLAHMTATLNSHIHIYLGMDESINFTEVNQYVKETWPLADHDIFKPTSTLSYVSISGEKVTVNPGNPVLLEKVPEWPAGVLMEKTGPDWTKTSSPRLQELLKPDGGAENDQVIDRSVDIQAKLYNFWCHTKDGVIGPMDFEWANDFKTFEKWAMDHGFKHGMCILRKDKVGSFTPDNCYVTEREKPDRSEFIRTRDL